MKDNNRKCVVCNTAYSYCPNCDEQFGASWKGSFCCESCRDLYLACVRYNRGVIAASELVRIVESRGVDDRWQDSIRETVDKALKEFFENCDEEETE